MARWDQAFFGNQKWSGGTIFGSQNRSGGPLLGRNDFCMTGRTSPPLRIRACAVLHLHVLRALIEHSKVTKSASGKGRQPSCGDCAKPPPPSLPVSVTVKTVPNILPPALPETNLCVVMHLSMAYSTWADVGEHRGICCQNLPQWVGTYHSNHILFRSIRVYQFLSYPPSSPSTVAR